MNFSFHNPTKIQFGQGQIAEINSLISNDTKTLVIYGQGSIKNNGIYDQVAKALRDHDWTEFSGVEVNPTIETLDKAVAIVKAQNIDFILAVGGGSVIDGAKYVAAAAHYDGDGWDILNGTHTIEKATELGAILTLPATGSEANANAVITKASTQEKLAFAHPLVQPQFAVMDPNVMKTLPKRQLINGIVDAWVHVCEQYLTFSAGTLVQDGYAEALLKSLHHLGKHFDKQDDLWRANLMWSANQALNGLIGAGVSQDWATHMIGHELTALYNVDHARSLAIIQPSLLRNQINYKRTKLEQMGRTVFGLNDGPDLAESTIDTIENFYQDLGVATTLTEHNTDKSQAIDDIIQQLDVHQCHHLGENNHITLIESRQILENAVA